MKSAYSISGGVLNPDFLGQTSSVLIYNANDINKGPIKGESLLYERKSPACTIFNSPIHEGRPVAIVGGGQSESFEASYTAEIWDYTKEGTKWEESKLILHFFKLLFYEK